MVVWFRAQGEWRGVSDDGEPNVLSEAEREMSLGCNLECVRDAKTDFWFVLRGPKLTRIQNLG